MTQSDLLAEMHPPQPDDGPREPLPCDWCGVVTRAPLAIGEFVLCRQCDDADDPIIFDQGPDPFTTGVATWPT
jgi:hypothetical protein